VINSQLVKKLASTESCKKVEAKLIFLVDHQRVNKSLSPRLPKLSVNLWFRMMHINSARAFLICELPKGPLPKRIPMSKGKERIPCLRVHLLSARKLSAFCSLLSKIRIYSVQTLTMLRMSQWKLSLIVKTHKVRVKRRIIWVVNKSSYTNLNLPSLVNSLILDRLLDLVSCLLRRAN